MFKGPFFVIDEKWPKNVHHTTQTRNFTFDLFLPRDSNGIDLTRGNQALGGYFDVSQIRYYSSIYSPILLVVHIIHVVSMAFFQYDAAALSGEASDDR